MHPDAVQNVTRFCNQTFWPCSRNNSCDFSDQSTIQQGYNPECNFSKKTLTDFMTESGLNRYCGFPDEVRPNRTDASSHTPLSPQNKYPTQRNSLRGFLARKILTYLPLPPNPAVANTSSWLRRVFSHAFCLSMIRVWAFPMFSHCSPPHVR